MGTLSEAETPPSPELPAAPSRKRLVWIGACLFALVLAGVTLPPLLAWQRAGQMRAQSLSNVRRLAFGALLYSQDWDGRLMPPESPRPNGRWQTWPDTLRPYVGPVSVFNNPANPITSEFKHPSLGYSVRAAYAVNRRFWNTFAPGPFPLENLELPAQTALFVEAGPMRPDPLRPPAPGVSLPKIALLDYGDMLDRVNGLCPYPSVHDKRMAVAAADGHGLLVTVEHYRPSDGDHDVLYGRLGGDIYNWNGGHPNGATDTPPRE